MCADFVANDQNGTGDWHKPGTCLKSPWDRVTPTWWGGPWPPGGPVNKRGDHRASLSLRLDWFTLLHTWSTVVSSDWFSDRCQQPGLKARPKQFFDDRTSFFADVQKMHEAGKRKKRSKRFSSMSARKMWVCQASLYANSPALDLGLISGCISLMENESIGAKAEHVCFIRPSGCS